MRASISVFLGAIVLSVCAVESGTGESGAENVDVSKSAITGTQAAIVFRNTDNKVGTDPASGEVALMVLNGQGGVQFDSAISGAVPAAWQIVGTGDFNHDGVPDFLWQDTQLSEVGIWQMTAANGVGAYLYPSKTVTAAWVVKGTGDFNGDGTTDILWQDTQTTQVGIWQMQNGAIASYLYPAATVAAEWVIKGTGDFNGDGTTDILWQDTKTTQVGIWQMKNGAVANYLYPAATVPTAWVIQGTGDFNGDGTTDILWRNSATTQVGIWQMKNNAVANYLYPASTVPSAWVIKGTGDFDGDGTTDILWLDTQNAQVGVWQMKNDAIANYWYPGYASAPMGLEGTLHD